MKGKYLLSGIILFVAIGTVLVFCKNSFAENEISYKSYYNSRFDFHVQYPSRLLIPQGESDNGDGQKFVSQDGQRQMMVYNNFMIDPPASFRDLYEEELKTSSNVSGKSFQKTYYYIFGKNDKNLFRRYTFLLNDNYIVLYFEYPQNDAKEFEPITEYVYKSVGNGKP